MLASIICYDCRWSCCRGDPSGGAFNAMMLIRFVFSAHRLGFLMLLRFVALDWVPIRFVFECYSDWGFECHMPKWNPLIKKLFDSLVYKFVHNM